MILQTVLWKPFLQVQIQNVGYEQLKNVTSYRARFTHYQLNSSLVQMHANKCRTGRSKDNELTDQSPIVPLP